MSFEQYNILFSYLQMLPIDFDGIMPKDRDSTAGELRINSHELTAVGYVAKRPN